MFSSSPATRRPLGPQKPYPPLRRARAGHVHRCQRTGAVATGAADVGVGASRTERRSIRDDVFDLISRKRKAGWEFVFMDADCYQAGGR